MIHRFHPLSACYDVSELQALALFQQPPTRITNLTGSYHPQSPHDAMEVFNPPDRPTKPPLSRSSSFKPSQPPRVSTAPQTSKKQHLHTRHHHRHGHTAKETIQSAIQLHPPSSFGDLLKQSTRSSTQSPSQSTVGSRAGSILRVDGSVESGVPTALAVVRPEDVTRERARAKVRER